MTLPSIKELINDKNEIKNVERNKNHNQSTNSLPSINTCIKNAYSNPNENINCYYQFMNKFKSIFYFKHNNLLVQHTEKEKITARTHLQKIVYSNRSKKEGIKFVPYMDEVGKCASFRISKCIHYFDDIIHTHLGEFSKSCFIVSYRHSSPSYDAKRTIKIPFLNSVGQLNLVELFKAFAKSRKKYITLTIQKKCTVNNYPIYVTVSQQLTFDAVTTSSILKVPFFKYIRNKHLKKGNAKITRSIK